MRREFPQSVRKAAWKRCGGFCEGTVDGVRCNYELRPRQFTFDHIVCDALGGEPTLENCQILCPSCDDFKTNTQDKPRIAKAIRLHEKHIGLRKPSDHVIPGSRRSPFKKKINGQVERRNP
jgi:5-methylcytosine-specific restriction protein A